MKLNLVTKKIENKISYKEIIDFNYINDMINYSEFQPISVEEYIIKDKDKPMEEDIVQYDKIRKKVKH